MNRIELINGNIELHSKKNNHHITLSQATTSNLKDIEFSVYTFPVWSQYKNRKLLLDEANDINFYLNYSLDGTTIEAINFTQNILDELTHVLNQDTVKYSKQLIDCLNKLSNKQKRGGYDEVYISHSKIKKMNALLESDPSKITNFLNKKWDENSEDSTPIFGNDTPYHICNFLGWGITIPNISIGQIARKNNIDLNKVTGITLSAGKDPMLDENFERYSTGGLNYELELIKSDPLYNYILQLSSTLNDTYDDVQVLLENREAIEEGIANLSIETKNLDIELKNITQKINEVLKENK